MYKITPYIKGVFDNLTIVMVLLVALFLLLVDGPNFKNRGFLKEYRIVQIISYSYIVLGIIIFIFLRRT
ncbi:hypothetical protein CULT_1560009 [[Clostridium] ultunense Esp]|uniref:Uncharacterized protein n=1 Tax=[Clostridium] ultunense Esp TaxID=1288971 RepID=M1Z8K1_9FIRM|nr:CLC_0170 family protein [Schnuerera ultunensis]CCQ93893.1 hypothetical protein CULT_1560009 [[Clostridium] ultunense Esp]SHD76182.1 conserved protein of unknown function [[Clostridium] ultunense Esp]